MDLEQLLSTLKVTCLNDPYRRDQHHQNETDVMIYRFRHWCYTNKVTYDTITRDVFTSDRGRSLVLQWFKHHRQTTMYNHLVQIIAAHCQQQHGQKHHKRHPVGMSHGDRNQDRDGQQHHKRQPVAIDRPGHKRKSLAMGRQEDNESLSTPLPDEHENEAHRHYEYSPALLLKPEETERDLQSLVHSLLCVDGVAGLEAVCELKQCRRIWV